MTTQQGQQRDYMKELLENGISVIPYPQEIRTQFNRELFLSQQKEFIEINKDTVFVMGGFGAFGNPSSFHHEEIRKLRLAIYAYMLPHFKKTFKDKYLEGLVDRFAKRQPGTSVSPESWHRDVSNIKKNETRGVCEDIIMGGWVNLDETNTQFFTCVPKTHNEPTNGSGFSKILKEDAPYYKSKKEKISIPPNHLIIFNEKLVHAVTPSKIKTESYRLFMKYRITANPTCPLFDPKEITQIINDQGVFPLSLEQIPPMYSKTHLRNWKSRVETFSSNFKPVFLTPKKKNTVKNTAENASNEKPQYVLRILPSLKKAELELFTPYTDEEKQMLTLIKL